jgi:hypothetical protein
MSPVTRFLPCVGATPSGTSLLLYCQLPVVGVRARSCQDSARDKRSGSQTDLEPYMNKDSKPETNVVVEKLRNGRWAFVIRRGSVVYPASGQFTSQLQAQVAGQMALKALQKRG